MKYSYQALYVKPPSFTQFWQSTDVPKSRPKKLDSEDSQFWLRLVEGLTEQREPTNPTALGKRIKVAQSSARKWQKGVGLPSMDNAVELARLSNRCVQYLLSGNGPKIPEPTDQAWEEIKRIWTQLSEPEKAAGMAMFVAYFRRARPEGAPRRLEPRRSPKSPGDQLSKP